MVSPRVRMPERGLAYLLSLFSFIPDGVLISSMVVHHIAVKWVVHHIGGTLVVHYIAVIWVVNHIAVTCE
jgi:hypothetical protein